MFPGFLVRPVESWPLLILRVPVAVSSSSHRLGIISGLLVHPACSYFSMTYPVLSVLSLSVLIVTDHSCGDFIHLVTFLTIHATRFTRPKGQESGFKLINFLSN